MWRISVKRKRASRESLRDFCGEIHDDDGVDPRDYFRMASQGRPKREHKTIQLCRQVARTLDLVLGGEISDPVLNGLTVTQVVPAPNASHLLVTLTTVCADEKLNDVVDVLARLESASGQLRTAVASAITRKRAPQLSFQVVPGLYLETPNDGSFEERERS
jgi:ribosome-binding factor A